MSGRPISLFWLASAQTVGVTAAAERPETSFVEVLPGRPDDGDDPRVAIASATSDASAASAAC